MVTTEAAELVVAAQRGDSRALDSLVGAHLPLVYNLAGRALRGHADVDDVVQETMLRVVTDLPALRSPDSFRSWLVAITMRQVTERMRRRSALARRTGALDEAEQVADRDADFADVTVLRLGLAGQRRQVAEAVRWLDADDRELLALWWLEVGGRLTRAEVAEGAGLSPGHTAVRVQRLRGRLDLCRTIVAALSAEHRCAGLTDALAGWDGEPAPRWRKRIARHVRDCGPCGGRDAALIPVERLLAGLLLVPVPAGLAAAVAVTGKAATGAAALAAAAATGTGVSGALAAGASGAGGAGGTGAAGGAVSGAGAAGAGKAGVLGWIGQAALAKPVVAVVAGATLAAGAAGAVYLTRTDRTPPRQHTVIAAPATTAPRPAPPATARPSAKPSPSATTKAAVYGSVVDRADRAPGRTRKPAALPHRPEGTLAVVASADNDPRPDVYSLVHRGEQVTFRGRGYLRIEYQIAYTQRSGGLVPPSWTGLTGRLMHVASGGGVRLDDPVPGQPAGTTFMGTPAVGYTVLPAGAQQMWKFEYFYLDGEVTLHQNERGADYNLYVHLVTWRQVHDDVFTGPPAGGPVAGQPFRYGLTRDPGTDACPVPQYVTRADPADPATVPQSSDVR